MKAFLGVKPAKYEDGTDLADVMRWNEYGTETIPPRPVLMMAAEKIVGGEEFKEAMTAYLKNLIANPGEAESLEKELLRKIGSQSVAEAKRIIKAGAELQRNAPSTIRKKGPGKPPLFDEGLMIKNLAYEIGEDHE
jgi:hypothetical protein